MWRGNIVVASFAREGSHILSVKDRYGEKQNPALVFTIKIWPDQATLNAHSASFITRKTDLSPYLFAVGLALGGFAFAGVNFILGRFWARHLTVHDCGEIYKLRRSEEGTEITCELRCGGALRPGMEGAIYRPTGEHLCAATIARCENGEVVMVVDAPDLVRLGDVACACPGALATSSS
jgi:hypothetical protein